MKPPEYVAGTSEIGSLAAHSNEESQFVGSARGVYFIGTVNRAFPDGLDLSLNANAQEERKPPEKLCKSISIADPDRIISLGVDLLGEVLHMVVMFRRR